MVRFNWKKHLTIFIILAFLAGTMIPIGTYGIARLNPYLAFDQALNDPRTMALTNMALVDRKYSTHDNWTSITWRLDFQFTNYMSSNMIVPSANFTVNYFGNTLGNGWFSEDKLVKPGETKVNSGYLKLENNKMVESFFKALLIGHPLELIADFEAYILIDDITHTFPLFGLTVPTPLKFPLPSSGSGTPPNICSINRSIVQANQPVQITINATDSGTGISNNTFVYFSIDGGSSWQNVTMTGGTWVNSYLGNQLPNYFPIPSTEHEETFQAIIPGFSAGTNVDFNVYLEDYAANIDHEGNGNYIVSKKYSYTVPNMGELPEYYQRFEKEEDVDFFGNFLSYLDANGMNLMHFLYLNDVVVDLAEMEKLAAVVEAMGEMTDFFYDNDIDAEYVLGILLIDFGKALSIMGDSGIGLGYLLSFLGIGFDDLISYLVDHVFLEINDEMANLANNVLNDSILFEQLNQTFTQDIMITNDNITNFLINTFRNTDNLPIIPTNDWIVDTNKSSYWNFLSLIASNNETNSHATAASLLLENHGISNYFDELITLVDGEVIPPKAPISEQTILSFTTSIMTILIYIALCLMVILALKKEFIILLSKKKLRRFT
ncbi:MAG: hypothetical protein ACFFD5_13815 [Candidatus Thorarchaeota archaeon]